MVPNTKEDLKTINIMDMENLSLVITVRVSNIAIKDIGKMENWRVKERSRIKVRNSNSKEHLQTIFSITKIRYLLILFLAIKKSKTSLNNQIFI